MKSGYVAITGKPNVGKSTLLNNILGQKVSITSPKPQTTRQSIEAVYEDKRGQIIFVDTPGIFKKVEDPVSAKINLVAPKALGREIAVAVYVIDPSRERDEEDNKVLGMVRKMKIPKILAINKMDIKHPSFLPHYKFMEEEFDKVVTISGMYKLNTNYLIDAIFELLPEGEPIVKPGPRATPLLNLDSKLFIGELIREKAYIFLRKELPYTLGTVVDEVTERDQNLTYVKARILTTTDKYKKMIIGSHGRMIKEIGMAARKELETATGKKFFIDLTVEENPHWIETLL
ncbi:GTPase Era [Candidatus Gottesmanbacteria bacterium RIFCSPHIGHO2_02_FULL_39_11]|uniref:GTPase Era n=1 Tax=Candidatus Gottesmanbacteria bacterium RIFCSPHIGHO2_02_FULL_39_11 TaxID=1798382 RepID=A0A1F5ZTG2_9BACT|nr:MAG: GTPase Era [Candidatus Gottesmanbacteria bacterium RIFCSPHIGHO2_02_FULL_39_11]